MTNEQIKQEFYKMACDYSISQGAEKAYITLSGLNENLPKALTLLNDLLENAKLDREAYSKMVELIIKSRNNQKTNQNANFSALFNYGRYGLYNSVLNHPSAEK